MKILIVGPAWIGDMVMSQSLFKLIAQRHPNASIDVLAPAWSLPILSRMPEVHSGIVFPFQHGEFMPHKRYQFAKKLKSSSYEKAYVIPNSFKSALVPYFAKIPQRTGWRGEYRYGLLNDVRIMDKEKYPLMVQRFLALGLEKNEPLPQNIEAYYPAIQTSSQEITEKLSQYQISLTGKPILALCPGAEFGESKRWLPKYFAEVANVKIAAGWEVWLFGSPNEKTIAEEIMSLTNQNCRNMVGKTSLVDAIDFLSLSNAIIANDSGLMHISAALNRPLIAIYGATPANLAPPLTSKTRVLSMNLACSPCFKRECPLGHFDCMTKITPQLVLSTIDEMLGS